MTRMLLLSGNANPMLASDIAEHLKLPLVKSIISQFKDGESRIEILESVRGKDVFIIQPTSNPTNHHLIELILIADAVKRAKANRITAVVPYFGYARQDKPSSTTSVPICAKVIANLLAMAQFDQILTVDLHSELLQGFFSIAIENVHSTQLFLEDIKQKQYKNPIVVSPDIGGVIRARALAERFNEAELTIIDKRRTKTRGMPVVNIMGNVQDRDCIILDDLIDTANTVSSAANALKEKGANKVVAYITHPVLSGDAILKLKNSLLDELIVTDTIPLTDDAKTYSKLRIIRISAVLAKAIQNIYQENLND